MNKNHYYVFLVRKAAGLVSVALLACIILASCKGKVQEMPKVKYETKVVEPESVVYNMIFPATTSGIMEIKMYPQIEGIITAKNFFSGNKVQKGQTMYVIDPMEYKLKVKSAEADLNVAKADMETAKLEYESNQELFKNGVISEYVLQTSRNSYNSAVAQVQQAESQLNIARTNLGYCTVTAPVSGYADDNDFEVGDMATRSNYLGTVSDNSIVKAIFSLTETDVLRIEKRQREAKESKGSSESKEMAVKLQLKDGTVYERDGHISKIEAIVNSSTGTVLCEASFKNPDRVLRSGLSANVIIPITLDSVLAVPQTAAVRLQDQMMFYRVKSDGTVEGVICNVYPSNDGKEYYITNGLNPGDEVVTNGAGKLSNGMKIR